MKPLFLPCHRMNLAGMALTEQVQRVLTPIVRSWLADGYSPREISHLIILEAMSLEMEGVLSYPAPSETYPADSEPTEV